MVSSHRRQNFSSVRHNAHGILAAYLLLAVLLSFSAPRPSAAGAADVPSVSGGMGPCTADFTVVDSAGKPVYDAKVHLKVKYGFMSKKDTDLEVATNSDGKAHMEGLPDKLKKPPMEFTVTKGDLTSTLTDDPASDCHGTFNVTLGK